jgi:allantoin racemase
MKLWYQSLARDVESSHYGEMLRKIFASCANPGTEIHLQGIHKSSGFGVHYRYLEHNDVTEVIENALRAEREGYDAFLIANVSDAGIREAREMLNIPVLGLCETSMHIACMMGANFGMVNINRKWAARNYENVVRAGLLGRLVGMEPLDTSPLALKQAMTDNTLRDQTLESFKKAARRLLDKGAEVIIPAGGDIIVFLMEDNIYEIDGAPVLNGIVELIKMGEVVASLKKFTGRFKSRRLEYSSPSGDFLGKVRSFYGPDVYPDAPGQKDSKS